MIFDCLSSSTLLLGLALALSVQTKGSGEGNPSGKPDFYVAPFGRDSWSGRLPDPNDAGDDGPFATLDRARQAVRDLRQADHPITVQVRGGEYLLSEAVVFTPEDSGTADSPIVYEAYPGEKPVFKGGRRIAGWKKGEGGTLGGRDTRCESRKMVFPSTARQR